MTDINFNQNVADCIPDGYALVPIEATRDILERMAAVPERPSAGYFAKLYAAALAAPQPQSPDTEAQPVEWPPLVQLGRTLAFFASAIKSGEAWSDTCQRDYDLANQAMKDIYRDLSTPDTGAQGAEPVQPVASAAAMKAAARLRGAIARAEDGAGTPPAKIAVKLIPSDWHNVVDAARCAADLLAQPQASREARTFAYKDAADMTARARGDFTPDSFDEHDNG